MSRFPFREMIFLLIGGAVVVALAVSMETSTPGSSRGASSPPPTAEAPTGPFGIRTRPYTIEKGRVEWGETFSDLLGRYGVEYQTILELAEAARPAFNVQTLRAGTPYRVYMNPWLQQAQYVVCSLTPVRYVVFNVQRPERTNVETRAVQRQWATVGGTIEGSLYETLVENGGPPMLALRLSEVFAWQIDFFRLRAGDQFRIIYEKRSVGGEPLQPGPIVAAYVEHLGERYYAFRFETGSGAKYFNRQGQSLRRQLLKAPLQYTRITSEFTHRRFHPILKEYRPHHGTDYAAPRGTPVHAVGDGIVQVAGYRGPNGNYVEIRHNGTYTSGYLHLSRIADGIEPGSKVKQGETIGYVGSTGRSTGPHLDYRLWKHGTPVDPYTLDLPPSQPVPIRYRDEFQRTVNALMPRLRRSSVFAGRRGGTEAGGKRS